MALSMLSFGIFAALALSIATRSRKFVSGFGPPSRAAMTNSLVNLVKICPFGHPSYFFSFYVVPLRVSRHIYTSSYLLYYNSESLGVWKTKLKLIAKLLWHQQKNVHPHICLQVKLQCLLYGSWNLYVGHSRGPNGNKQCACKQVFVQF